MVYCVDSGKIIFLQKGKDRGNFFKNFLHKPSVMVPVSRVEIETKVEQYFTMMYMRYDPNRAEARTKKEPHIWIPAMVCCIQFTIFYVHV
jgi:hypothetical protein